MSYIHKFFQDYLTVFYLGELRQRLQNPKFLLFNNQDNIFDLTLDLILSSQKCLQSQPTPPPVPQLASLCKISYDELKEVSLPVKQQDNDVVKILKTSLKYAHMQLFQLLIRLVLCFYYSLNSKAISETLRTEIREISLIYPALKIQITFSHPEINLCNFFEKYLEKITQSLPFNEISRIALEKIADQSFFIGPLEKLFKKYTQIAIKQGAPKESKPFMDKSMVQLLGKEPKNSNLAQNQNKKSQKMSSVCSQKLQKFDEWQMFRNKKRKTIIKQRLKSTEAGYKTPNREHQSFLLNTPNTGKQQKLVVRSDTTQNNPSSILFRRTLSKKAHPAPKRTLYFNQTHQFMPKKPSYLSDSQLLIQKSIAAYSHINQCFNPQPIKRTEKKPSIYSMKQSEESLVFCVPQTPKPNHAPKESSNLKQAVDMDQLKL